MTESNAKRIFTAALDLPPEDRNQYLDEACADKVELRQRVEDLLAAHGVAASFLDDPLGAFGIEKEEEVTAPGEAEGQRIGRYKLLQQIGEGGFGTVWMAEQQVPIRRTVALKIIKRGMDTRRVIARFEAERQALAMMDHPNIAKVLDGGETPGGRPYFVMELVRGVSITEFCDAQHLDARERLVLFTHVCHAVHHAHQKGILHRDIKPSNILVTLHDGVPVPKVIDFGIAKATHQPLTEKTLFTEFGRMVGTPEYMAPEQAEMSGLDVDTRADIYSLGVVLYELLTGTKPLEVSELLEKGYVEVLRVIQEDDPHKPSTRVSTLGERSTDVAKRRHTDPGRLGKLLRGDVDWIVMKALEKDRARRYESAAAFARDVRRHLDDEPVVASPPSRTYKLLKYVRRNRVVVAAGMLVFVSLVAGIIVFAIENARANDNAKVAQARLRDAEAARAGEEVQRQIAEQRRTDAEEQRTIADQQRAIVEARNVELEDVAYASTLRAVAEQLDAGWIEGLADQLDGLDEERRGFPWRWLRARAKSRGARVVSNAVSGAVQAAEFSPDGTRILVHTIGLSLRRPGGVDTVQVLDTATGDELFRLNEAVALPRYSPDGTLILTGGPDASIRLFDAENGELMAERTHPSAVLDLQFAPDGAAVVVLGSDQSLRRYGVEPDLELSTVLEGFAGFAGMARLMRFSPDGSRLLIAGDSDTAWLVDAVTGDRSVELRYGDRPGMGTAIHDAAFSPDGGLVMLTGQGGRVAVWDADGGGLVRELEPHRQSNNNLWHGRAVSFSADGRFAVSAGSDARARVYAVESWRRIAILYYRGMRSARFDPASTTILFTSRQLGILELEKFAVPLELVVSGDNRDIRLDPDPRFVWTASSDGIRKWDLHSGAAVFSRLGQDDTPLSVDVSPDGRLLAVGRADGTGVILDADTGEELHRITAPEGHDLAPAGSPRLGFFKVRFSPDPKSRLLAAGVGRTLLPRSRDVPVPIFLFDVDSGAHRMTLSGHQGTLGELAFSPDGTRLASLGLDHAKLVIWDAESGEPIHEPRVGRTGMALAFSPDGKIVVSGYFDGWLAAHDVTTGEELWGFRAHQGAIGEIDFDAEGARMLTLSTDWQIRVWDTRFDAHREATLPDRLLTIPLDDHFWPNTARFTRDGSGIVVGSKFLRPVSGGVGYRSSSALRVYEIETPPGTFERRSVVRRAALRVRELLEEPRTLSALGDAVRNDPELDTDARARSAALAIVGGIRGESWGLTSRNTSNAFNALMNLYLETDRMVSGVPIARERLGELLRGGSPAVQLNDAAWFVVRVPDLGSDDYRMALRAAREATGREPKRHAYVNTLGVAEYRAGQLDDAVATLTRSAALMQQTYGYGSATPADWAFLAMAEARRGDPAAAQAALERTRTLMQDATIGAVAEYIAFLREAERVVGGR